MTAALSPTFYSWVDMFEGKMLIAGPQEAADLLAAHRAKLQDEAQRQAAIASVVEFQPPEDAAVLFEAQWKAFLATKETEKSAKKAAAPEEEVAPEESAAEEVTEVQTAAEAPAPEAEAVEAEAPPEDVAE